MSTTLIIIIVVVVVVVLAAAGGLMWWFVFRKKGEERTSTSSSTTPTGIVGTGGIFGINADGNPQEFYSPPISEEDEDNYGGYYPQDPSQAHAPPKDMLNYMSD